MAIDALQDAARCYGLVPCAGIGERAGQQGPKQYALLGGRPVVTRTLDALAAVRRIEATLVVLAPHDEAFERHTAWPAPWVVRAGGASRAQTVLQGLAALAERGVRDADWVLVHDAARCLVRPNDIERLIDACLADEVGGLLAVPVADTLKRAGTAAEPRVASTIERAGAWQAQTPQMFRLGLLRRAFAAAGAAATDEASAIESLGFAPRLVPGRIDNFKLTWPDDFALAERLLAG